MVIWNFQNKTQFAQKVWVDESCVIILSVSFLTATHFKLICERNWNISPNYKAFVIHGQHTADMYRERHGSEYMFCFDDR